MKSSVADLRNIGDKYAGACTAAAFLREFVGKTPWAHIDIAGTAWAHKPRSYETKGATGYGVRLLTEYLLNS
jgi:leucyl aminopeptidase